MTIRSCLVLALIVGIVGAFLGGVTPRNAPSVQAVPSASSAPSAGRPAGRSCKAERADLAVMKAQLAICMAYGTRGPETQPSDVAEASEPDLSKPDPRVPSAEEIRRNRELLESYPEAVIVQHDDGTTGVYKPDEWPTDGDGTIVARKLASGRLGWYAGPDAGPRSDPAAFQPWDAPIDPLPTWGREPDGTITIGGKPASRGVQLMFGGKVDEPAKP